MSKEDPLMLRTMLNVLDSSIPDGGPRCVNCGLAITEEQDNGWIHADGYIECPPGFHATAKPEI